MAQKLVNKVIYGGNTLIDLTSDTVTTETLLVGAKAHDKSGAIVEGTCTFDVDSTDATATAAEILAGKTGYVAGNKLTGTMPNKGAVNGSIASKDEQFTIPAGYHDGSGKVGIDATEKEKLVPGNILAGVEILGVTGTCDPASGVTAQTKSVTPGTEAQTIIPDEDYDYLSQVNVAAIPYTEVENEAGGITVTIAG